MLQDAERRDVRRALAGRGVRQSVDRGAEHLGALEILMAHQDALAEPVAVVPEDSHERPAATDSNLVSVEPSQLAPAAATQQQVSQRPALQKLGVAARLRVVRQGEQVHQQVLREQPQE